MNNKIRKSLLKEMIEEKNYKAAYILLNIQFIGITDNLEIHIYNVKKVSDEYILEKTDVTYDLNNTSITRNKKIYKIEYYLDSSYKFEFSDYNDNKDFEEFLKENNINMHTNSKSKNNNKEGSLDKIKKLTVQWINIWILITSIIAIILPGAALLTIALVIYAMKETKTVKSEIVPNITYYNQVKSETEKLNKQYLELENKINDAGEELDTLSRRYNEKVISIEEINKSLNSKYDELDIHDLEITNFEEISSSEIKNKLSIITLKEKDLVKENGVKIYNNSFTKSELNNKVKQIVRTFNAECDFYLSNVSASNIDTYRDRIVRAFETVNRLYKKDSIELSKELLKLKLQRLNHVYDFELKKEQEKELQKAAREQMLEEQRVQQEIERQRKEINKEEKHFNKEINKLMKFLQKTTSEVEKELYLSKIQEFESKLKDLEKDKQDVENRAANTRAGYVYVISNIGSFGENVYKIGVTRRLEPMDRIQELSSASVPFPFDVHAMIFSEDAPKLETTLHKHFRNREINKVNSRKEFFNVELDEIEKVVTNNHNDTVEFTLVPVATEYRETIKHNENQKEVG